MICYSNSARNSHIRRIKELQKIVATIPGDVVGFGDSTEIIKYLGWLIDAIQSEQREETKRFHNKNIDGRDYF